MMRLYVVIIDGCGECEGSQVVGLYSDRAAAGECQKRWSSRSFRESQDPRPVEHRDTCARTSVRIETHEVVT